ncbi:hypothetical protein BGX27_011145 [Mortierella sp. AM989]|nr:hypothetical protein BGX27_011145 [Mortierella sp. AM989]
MSVLTITPAMVASGSFSNNNKTEPLSATPLAIDIPFGALSALEHARNIEPPTTPPLLSSSASSTTSFESMAANTSSAVPAVAGEDARTRRVSQDFYFPRQSKFESAVPVVVRARDIHLKDHPIIEGAYAEYEKLYNADSLMTEDGRPMVRLL